MCNFLTRNVVSFWGKNELFSSLSSLAQSSEHSRDSTEVPFDLNTALSAFGSSSSIGRLGILSMHYVCATEVRSPIPTLLVPWESLNTFWNISPTNRCLREEGVSFNYPQPLKERDQKLRNSKIVEWAGDGGMCDRWIFQNKTVRAQGWVTPLLGKPRTWVTGEHGGKGRPES